MKKTYIHPAQVISPKRRWSLIAVLDDEGEEGATVAIGRWESVLVLAIRWNGTNENPIGNPQSRGLPTWFVVPNKFRDGILGKLPSEKSALAQSLFDQEREQDDIVGVARRNPETGNTTWRFPRTKQTSA